ALVSGADRVSDGIEAGCLEHITARPCLGCLCPDFGAREAREDHDLYRRMTLANLSHHPGEVPQLRHLVVEPHDVRATTIDHFDEVAAIVRLAHHFQIAVARQREPQHFTKHRMVVGDENTDHRYLGLDCNGSATTVPVAWSVRTQTGHALRGQKRHPYA